MDGLETQIESNRHPPLEPISLFDFSFAFIAMSIGLAAGVVCVEVLLLVTGFRESSAPYRFWDYLLDWFLCFAVFGGLVLAVTCHLGSRSVRWGVGMAVVVLSLVFTACVSIISWTY